MTPRDPQWIDLTTLAGTLMTQTPVVYILFNRPDHVAKSFECIREAKPSKLFLVSDAARKDRPGEEQKVQHSRAIAEAVDWPCEVIKLYAESNMGCGKRISSGITAAMKTSERVIVLEDDCIADTTFFSYCDALLERYDNDPRVMAISGDNFQQGQSRTESSYYFSKYPHCWGWATWRRAWQHFQLKLPAWETLQENINLNRMLSDPKEREFWKSIWHRVQSGRVDSWAFPWHFACWQQGGLTALPDVNLVQNIGFDDQSTHTRESMNKMSVPLGNLPNIQHPGTVQQNIEADQFTDSWVFSGTVKRRGPIKRFSRWLRGKDAA